MSLLETQLVSTAHRLEHGDGVSHEIEYTLWRDLIPAGSAYYYIKCYRQSRRGASPAEAELEIADGLGNDADLAAAVFSRLVAAADPPHPVHLKDIIRDAVIEYAAEVEAGEAVGTLVQ